MRSRVLLSILVFLALPALARSGEAPAEQDILVEVNGAPITGADLEAMIVEFHQSGTMSMDAAEGLVPRLLEKAIRDELILQDAFAMGMGEDPGIVEPIRQKAIRRAISLYGRDQVRIEPVTEDQVDQFFQDYYHKIRIRQFSASTPEECLDALRRIQSGEVTMGALATQLSLDPKGPRGGLHNDMYWADVDTMLRGASASLAVGEYSPPFSYGALWSVIRIESRTPPDPADLPRFEKFIRGVLGSEHRKSAWAAFVAERRSQVEIVADEAVLDRVRADREIVYRGEFKDGTDQPALRIDANHVVSEADFRAAMSTLAMGMGDSGFDEILAAAIEDQEQFLTLWWFAEKDGWFEKPEVVEYYEHELEQAVITNYLNEYIGQKIRFNREEYEQFYRDHQEDFRGAEQVRLSILIAEDEPTIQGVARRLAEGADFDYLRAEIEGRDAESAVTSKWSTITSFNDNVITAVRELEVGGTSSPLPYNDRWMILRLDGRRQGEVPPIEEVDGTIREALYYREFSELLDEQLARLSEASTIVRHEDRIRAWAENES